MKMSSFLGAAAAALLAMPAAAQPQGERGQGVTRDQIESRVGAMFSRLDSNRDGFITQAEAEDARTAARARMTERRGDRRAALFARLDADGNGVISRDEFTAPRARAEGEPGERRERRIERIERPGPGMAGRGGRIGARLGAEALARMDADGDGRVSLAEATRFRLERFDRVDSNDDGRISREEIEAFRAQRPAR